MLVKTQWETIPTYTINVSSLQDPYEICHILKSHNTDKYLYRIKYKGIIIKYGMSADRSRNFGERLYRQIAHSASWGEFRNTGSSGADFRIIEEDFFNLYGISIDKNYLEIKIWDVTNYEFVSTNPRNEIIRMENELIEKYISVIGEKPIGNINDEANIKNKGLVPLFLTQKLFSIE